MTPALDWFREQLNDRTGGVFWRNKLVQKNVTSSWRAMEAATFSQRCT